MQQKDRGTSLVCYHIDTNILKVLVVITVAIIIIIESSTTSISGNSPYQFLLIFFQDQLIKSLGLERNIATVCCLSCSTEGGNLDTKFLLSTSFIFGESTPEE